MALVSAERGDHDVRRLMTRANHEVLRLEIRKIGNISLGLGCVTSLKGWEQAKTSAMTMKNKVEDCADRRALSDSVKTRCDVTSHTLLIVLHNELKQ